MTFADFLTGLHNLLRWLVLLGGVLALVAMISGLSGRRFGPGDRRAGLIYTILLDVQLVLGLLLMWFGDTVGPVLRNMGSMGDVMSNSALRQIVVEHPLLMIVAVILAHVGSSQSRKAGLPDRSRFMRGAIFYGLSLVAIFAAIPWARSLIPWV